MTAKINKHLCGSPFLLVKQPAYRILFPVAALYASLIMPLSIYARYYGIDELRGLTGIHHGHEMLFGFTLLVIAGYLLGKIGRCRLALYGFLWLGARALYTAHPEGLIGNSLTIVFGFLLAWEVAPKFFVAKQWRNKMLSPLIISIGSFPIVFMAAHWLREGLVFNELLHGMVILLSLLMAYMGGRMIAPAVANEYQKQGIELQARLQPRVEATFIILLPLALAMSLMPALKPISGIVLIFTGLTLFVRLARWRLWRCYYRADLMGLGAGYSWLAIGLICLGVSFATDYHIVTALHVITIGAIGTLSTVVMLRVHYQRKYRTLPDHPVILISILLISITTIARVIGGVLSDDSYIVLAAACWSFTYMLVAYWLIKSRSSAQV